MNSVDVINKKKIMLKAYKYQLDVNKTQAEYFAKCFGCCRWVYNWALDKRIKCYQVHKKGITAIDLIKELTPIKKQEETKWLARSIASASWSEFIRQLKYKAGWYGKNFVTIGRFEPSSKLCSNCGALNQTLTLQDREWACATCGTFHDRDINAATNIKKFGLQKQNLITKNSGEGIAVADAGQLASSHLP